MPNKQFASKLIIDLEIASKLALIMSALGF